MSSFVEVFLEKETITHDRLLASFHHSEENHNPHPTLKSLITALNLYKDGWYDVPFWSWWCDPPRTCAWGRRAFSRPCPLVLDCKVGAYAPARPSSPVRVLRPEAAPANPSWSIQSSHPQMKRIKNALVPYTHNRCENDLSISKISFRWILTSIVGRESIRGCPDIKNALMAATEALFSSSAICWFRWGSIDTSGSTTSLSRLE